MVFVTNAIVLHNADYKDYDRMVTLFSPVHGRIDAIARGCRRPKSALMGVTDMFCAGEYTITEAADRRSITQCQLKESFYNIRFDYDKLTHACYCLSLADTAVLPDQPADALFYLLLETLTFLADSDLPNELMTSAFEMRFMHVNGFTPQMKYCVSCGAPVEGDCRFDEEKGGVICSMCKSSAPRISDMARRIILKSSVSPYRNIPLLKDHEEWKEAARLFRPFVERRIDRRFRTTVPDLPD